MSGKQNGNGPESGQREVTIRIKGADFQVQTGEETYRGTVRWFQGTHGFIVPENPEIGTPDVFVHFSNIVAGSGEYKKLEPGDDVEFTLVNGPKGPAALQVKKLHTQYSHWRPSKEKTS